MISEIVAFVAGRPWILVIAALLGWASIEHYEAASARSAEAKAQGSLKAEEAAHGVALKAAQDQASAVAANARAGQEKAHEDADNIRAAAAATHAADRSRLDRAQRLLDAANLRARSSAGSGDPAAAGQCQATVAAYGDVLSTLGQRHSDLGSDADTALAGAYAAGVECQGRYEALRAATMAALAASAP